MALNIINDPSLTAQLATGLGQGLTQLAQVKAQNLLGRQQRQQTTQGLQAIPGVNEEMASQLSQLPPELLQMVVKQQLATPGNQSFANALQQIIGGGAQEGQQSLPVQGLNSQQAAQLAQLQFQKEGSRKKEDTQARKEAHEEQKVANKETKEYYDNVVALSDAADASEKRLDKMDTLINKKGGLPVSTFYKLFKKLEEDVPAAYGGAAGSAAGFAVGGPVGAAIGGTLGALISPIGTLLRSAQTFSSPNAEEFEKLSNDFVREAKTIFGSRITDNDLKVFMSMVPSLSQTDNGKKAIIKNMRNFLEANQIKAKYLKQIIKENKGQRPFDLRAQVEERSKNELDKLAKEFSA